MKRILAALAAAAVLLSQETMISFAENYEIEDIDGFYSFSDYTGEYRDSNVVYPDGFGNASVNRNVRLGYEDDEERGSRAVRIGSGAEILLPFNRCFEKGRIHISFDLKQVGNDNPTSLNKQLSLNYYSNLSGRYSAGMVNGKYVNSAGEFPQDDPMRIATDTNTYFFNTGCESYGVPMFLKNGANAMANGTVGYTKDKLFTAGEWHKIDVYLDKDNGKYSVYYDGELLEAYKWDSDSQSYLERIEPTIALSHWYETRPKYIKGISLRCTQADVMPGSGAVKQGSDGDGGAFLLDNLYVRKYKSDSNMDDEVSIIADDMGGEGVALSGGRVNVAFSEYMNQPPKAEDVVITNLYTGETVTDFELENADNTQFTAVFAGELAPGRYSVEVNGTAGGLTQNTPSNKAEFFTKNAYAEDGETSVEIPTFVKVGFENYLGLRQVKSTGISTTTNKIEIDFSAPVNPSYIEDNIKLFSDGDEKSYIAKTENGGKRVVLEVPEFFKGGAEYELYISEELKAGNSDNVTISGPHRELVRVRDDGKFELSNQSFKTYAVSKTAKFSMDVLKTDNSERTFLTVIAGYKNVSDESGATYKKMSKISYSVFDAGADERMITSVSSGSVKYENADSVRVFVLDYPSHTLLYETELTLK